MVINKFNHIIATISSVVYFWVSSQWLNIPLERTAYWTVAHSALQAVRNSFKWNIQSLTQYRKVNYTGNEKRSEQNIKYNHKCPFPIDILLMVMESSTLAWHHGPYTNLNSTFDDCFTHHKTYHKTKQWIKDSLVNFICEANSVSSLCQQDQVRLRKEPKSLLFFHLAADIE